jgi:hypothetical protein
MRRFLFIVMLLVLAAGALVWAILRPTTVAAFHIELLSDPFPMNVGPNTLRIRVRDAQGNALEASRVLINGQLDHPGAILMNAYGQPRGDGEYSALLTWTMMGVADVRITAEFPDGQSLQEDFQVFVYPVRRFEGDSNTRYVSQREIEVAVSANPEREKWIVIPLGTETGIRSGHGTEVIPQEILMNVSGQNTLVIRNDDIADHSVGPFFVRAGETVRQTFSQPAVYQGTCTILHSGEVNIVVDA